MEKNQEEERKAEEAPSTLISRQQIEDRDLSSATSYLGLVVGSSVVPAEMSTGAGKRPRPVAPSAPPAPTADGVEPTTVASRGCCGKSGNGGSGRGCCNRCLEKCVVCTATLTRVCLIIPNLVFLVSQSNDLCRKFSEIAEV